MVQGDDPEQLECISCGIYIFDLYRKEFFYEIPDTDVHVDEHATSLGIGSLYPAMSTEED